MTKPVLIQTVVFLPLTGLAIVFFALGWYLIAIPVAIAAVASLGWARRAAVRDFEDQAVRDNEPNE